jgi:hypothetical protein
MPDLSDTMFLLLVLISLVFSMNEMKVSLEDEDLSGFSVWTCVAGILSTLPLTL